MCRLRRERLCGGRCRSCYHGLPEATGDPNAHPWRITTQPDGWIYPSYVARESWQWSCAPNPRSRGNL